MSTQQSTVNPRTGQTDFSVEFPSNACLQRHCREFKVNQRVWLRRGLRGRISVLRAWHSVLTNQRHSLLVALTQDTGRATESEHEYQWTLRALEHWCDHATELLNKKATKSKLDQIEIYEHSQPYPLVANIGPWCFPLMFAIIDTLPALLAGCAVVVKPGELCPRFLEPLQATVNQVPKLARVLRFFPGGMEESQALIDQADLVCFTGSVPVGRQVASRCVARFIPCYLALGAKDAAIVTRDAWIGRAATACLWAGSVASGQACFALERLYAQDEIYEDFLGALTEKAQQIKLAFPAPNSGQLGPIVPPQQVGIIRHQLEDALAQGARLLTGGEFQSLGGGNYLPVTILADVTHNMKIMTTETMGPILPVMSFSSIGEAVALANDSIYGLGGAVFDRNVEVAMAIASRLDMGTVSVNDAGLSAQLIGTSGMVFKKSGLGGLRVNSLDRFLRKKNCLVKINEDRNPWWY